MSIQSLAEYTFKAKYAKYNEEEQRRENWGEVTERVFSMHAKKFEEELKNPKFKEYFDLGKLYFKQRKVLGSQRALQYASEPILSKNSRLYNCASLHVDRVKCFSEIFFMLLSGCGVGFSVQKCHINSLPPIVPAKERRSTLTFSIPDTIEGWADSLDELVNSYFYGGRNTNTNVEFDFSHVRPRGAYISGGFKAPGPEPLKQTLNLVREILEKASNDGGRQLKPIEIYDMIMHICDGVISGGIRRSASICLFDADDEEMINAKSEPYWWELHPQRARSNNSAVLIRNEVTKEQFNNIFEKVKAFGEPGFVFLSDRDQAVNPCLHGDSLIDTDKGLIKIKDLVDLYSKDSNILAKSYNIEKDEFEYKPILGALKTKENANVIKIELEDGRDLILTPDHQVLTTNGYKEAGQLTEEDEIIID